jgi:hypothetical protein
MSRAQYNTVNQSNIKYFLVYEYMKFKKILCISTHYGLDGLGIESRWGRDFPPVQTDPVAHPATRTIGTGSFPGVKCGRGRAADHSPLSSAEVLEEYSYTSTPSGPQPGL